MDGDLLLRKNDDRTFLGGVLAVVHDSVDWLQGIDDSWEAGEVAKTDLRRSLLTFLGTDVKNRYRIEKVSPNYDTCMKEFTKALTSSVYRFKIYSKSTKIRRDSANILL